MRDVAPFTGCPKRLDWLPVPLQQLFPYPVCLLFPVFTSQLIGTAPSSKNHALHHSSIQATVTLDLAKSIWIFWVILCSVDCRCFLNINVHAQHWIKEWALGATAQYSKPFAGPVYKYVELLMSGSVAARIHARPGIRDQVNRIVFCGALQRCLSFWPVQSVMTTYSSIIYLV